MREWWIFQKQFKDNEQFNILRRYNQMAIQKVGRAWAINCLIQTLLNWKAQQYQQNDSATGDEK